MSHILTKIWGCDFFIGVCMREIYGVYISIAIQDVNYYSAPKYNILILQIQLRSVDDTF